jgi:hypothetical protein
MAFYRNADGSYYGYSNTTPSDTTLVEVPVGPTEADQTWDGSEWVNVYGTYRTLLLEQLNDNAEIAYEELHSVYSAGEVSSFASQNAEALAYGINASVDTPFIDAQVTASGLTKPNVVIAILLRMGILDALVGNVNGQVIAIRQEIADAVDIAELEAISIEIT